MSPERLDGWEPRQVHEHYDDAGVFTGSTVVTHESEWTPLGVGKAVGLLMFEAATCPRCGQPMSEAWMQAWATPAVGKNGSRWQVHSEQCQSCALIEAAKRLEAGKHEKDDPADGKTGYMDGRYYYVTRR